MFPLGRPRSRLQVLLSRLCEAVFGVACCAAVFALAPYLVVGLFWWFDYDDSFRFYIDWFDDLTWQGFVVRAKIGLIVGGVGGVFSLLSGGR